MCVQDATQPLRITIPMMISRQNRSVFEFNTDAGTSCHNERKCVRGGDQFVDPTYCCASRCVVSGLPSTSLIYMDLDPMGRSVDTLGNCHTVCLVKQDFFSFFSSKSILCFLPATRSVCYIKVMNIHRP